MKILVTGSAGFIGSALSIKSSLNKPIKFVGTGEKIDAIDLFYPDRMAERILGMGDVVSLVERAQEQYDQEEAWKISKKIAKNKFGYDDFLSQIKKIKKMGGANPSEANCCFLRNILTIADFRVRDW